MTWPFPPPTRRDILIVLTIAAFVIVAVALNTLRVGAANWGFGPDWDCVNNGKGEPMSSSMSCEPSDGTAATHLGAFTPGFNLRRFGDIWRIVLCTMYEEQQARDIAKSDATPMP